MSLGSGSRIYKTAAWRSVRAATLRRDQRRCQIGLPGCLGVADQADHVIELHQGGAPYDLSNLQAACRPCNVAKNNMLRGGEHPVVRRRSW